MTKAELLQQMATDAGISMTVANAALDSFTDGITNTLEEKVTGSHWSDLAPF